MLSFLTPLALVRIALSTGRMLVILVFLAVFSTATFAQVPATYVVKAGDTWRSIGLYNCGFTGNAFSMTTGPDAWKIAWYNGIYNSGWFPFPVGSTVKIPFGSGGTPGPGGGLLYVGPTCAVNVPPIPTALSFAGGPFTLSVGKAITPIASTHSGGFILWCSIDKPLPTGLSLSPTDPQPNTLAGAHECKISGTPSAAAAAATYTITAHNTNTAGSSSATVSITVQ
jgi:hypothetical protein